MTSLLPVGRMGRWSGWADDETAREVSRICLSQAGRDMRKTLSARFAVAYERPLLFAAPLVVGEQQTKDIAAFIAAAHRMVTTISRRYPDVPELQQVVTIPEQVPIPPADLRRRQRFAVDLCRMDLYPTADGGFQLLEVNANCPGGVINAGAAAASWRGLLTPIGDRLAKARFEQPGWMARGLLAAMAPTDDSPGCVPVLCDRRGWRHETKEIAQTFRDLGLVSFVADPEEAVHVPGAGIEIRGHLARFGYQKMSIPALLAARDRAAGYFRALEAGDFHVQNGHFGRFIADNKLCLAVLSDDRFEGLFEESDRDLVRPHIPWSRNIASCDEEQVRHVLAYPGQYVVKEPLNTRGLGVVVGADVGRDEWRGAVENARQRSWLVQAYVEPTTVRLWPDEPGERQHDLSVFAVDGVVVGGFARSASAGGRVNVAAGGQTHPVFFSGRP